MLEGESSQLHSINYDMLIVLSFLCVKGKFPAACLSGSKHGLPKHARHCLLWDPYAADALVPNIAGSLNINARCIWSKNVQVSALLNRPAA